LEGEKKRIRALEFEQKTSGTYVSAKIRVELLRYIETVRPDPKLAIISDFPARYFYSSV